MIGLVAPAGSFALSLGLFGALTSAIAWGRAARAAGGDGEVEAARVRLARQAGALTLAGALGAVLVMEYALVGNDFSLRYVAENSSRGTPLPYRVTALWSALDGSLLLWLLALSGYAILVGRQASRASGQGSSSGSGGGGTALGRAAASVVAAVTFVFFAVTLAATRPFDVLLPAPADGPGPNPLLADHPAMAVHPPLLYLGYAGLVVPFGYAIAALVTGRTGESWTRETRRWVLVAWVSLTAGIVLGAWWSYAVLGWGGYWAWDPVENASLLPWLTATALVHTMLRSRSGASPVWPISLAAASFLLVCTGTFLTRSGVVLSVHAFTRSALGPALLGVVALGAGVVTGLLIWRSDRLAPADHPTRDGSPPLAGSVRGTALLLNNVLLVGLAVTVLAGTFLPVLAGLRGDDVSVGAPYYDRIAVPVGLLLLGLVVLGTVGRWRSEPASQVAQRVALPAGVAAVTVAALGLGGARGLVPVLALGLAAAVVTSAGREVVNQLQAGAGPPSTLWRRRLALGGHLAHAGLAIAAAGIAASSAWSASAQATVPVGGSVTVGGARADLVRVERHAGEDRMETAAVVRLGGPGRPSGQGSPALVRYLGRDQTVTVPAIVGDWRGDLYVTVLDVAQDGSTATLRLADEPLVSWIWFGGALTALGGAAAVGPGRRRRPATDRPGPDAAAPGAPEQPVEPVPSGAPPELVAKEQAG